MRSSFNDGRKNGVEKNEKARFQEESGRKEGKEGKEGKRRSRKRRNPRYTPWERQWITDVYMREGRGINAGRAHGQPPPVVENDGGA
jgi:hypothetical protein